MKTVRLAIVAPAFNESLVVQNWVTTLDRYFDQLPDVKATLVIVDDGSTDATFSTCQKLVSEVKNIKIYPLRLIRNFGHQAALICGLKFVVTNLKSEFDCVLTMDSDGEHPIAIVPELIKSWENGALITHTKRLECEELSLFKRITSKLFYKTIQWFASLPIENGMADFKLWDMSTLKAVESSLEKCGSLRLFAVFLCPNTPKIEFVQKITPNRVSRFSARKMLSLATQSLIFYSAVPMRLIGVLGVASLLASLALVAHAFTVYMQGNVVPGWTSMMVALSFFSGVNTICLFLVAEYLLRFSFRSKLPAFVCLNQDPAKSTEQRQSDKSENSYFA